mgnify:FL=1
MRGKPKKGKRAMRRQWRRKRARFEEGSRLSGAKRTETGWANGVFLHHAGRKDFFDTLNGPFGAVLKSAYASVWVGSISVGLGMGCSL